MRPAQASENPKVASTPACIPGRALSSCTGQGEAERRGNLRFARAGSVAQDRTRQNMISSAVRDME